MDKILRKRDVCTALGVSSSTLHRMLKAGKVPPPRRTGFAGVGWLESEIKTVIDGLEIVTAESTRQVAPGAKRGRKRNK